ncbi:hypothetical protein CK203_056235 [Vitis vinifera]|uniref:Uncharacterized protein n=1 Tax=Vitis vinifera TaxID=29760 RepID=A0A438GJP0_VITVI|nr:hypothetical protein CK203_056235 [Vitis vinifera]
MAGRTRGGRSERNEELETVREELREVRRELRETVELMRGQGSRRSRGSQESNALNGVRFGVEMKELHPLQADHSKLKEEFCTAAKSAFCCENFAAILHSARVFS